MSRTVPASLAAQYATGATTHAWGALITRTDGETFGWSSADQDATLEGVLYRSAPGLDVAALVSNAGFAVDNTELTLLADDAVVLKADVLAGRWDGAEFELFRYDWSAPLDRDIVKRGKLGNFAPVRGAYVAELRGLRQALQQSAGSVVQPVCRYRLGDSRCGVDLAGSPSWRTAGTVTAVASRLTFTAGAIGLPDDRTGGGLVEWLTGLNAGLTQRVRSQTAGGVFTLSLPMIFAIAIGDTFTATAGCRGRLLEDCKAKFGNVLNFGGEPHVPGQDALTSPQSVPA